MLTGNENRLIALLRKTAERDLEEGIRNRRCWTDYQQDFADEIVAAVDDVIQDEFDRLGIAQTRAEDV